MVSCIKTEDFSSASPIEKMSFVGNLTVMSKSHVFHGFSLFVVVASLLVLENSTQAAPDFKIRYNPKFPCLEVMDGKAVKITDISEGTSGEVVTSGKASIKLSFLKNADGQQIGRAHV